MRRTTLRLSLASAVALAAAACNRNPAASSEATATPAPVTSGATAAPLRCDLREGDRFGYTLATRAVLDGDIAALGAGVPSDTSGIDQRATFDIDFAVLDRTAGGSALVQFSQRRPGGAWSRALVKVAPNCAFEDIGLAPSMADAKKRELMSELQSFEFIGATDASTTWTAEQPLPYGKGRFAYRAEALADERTVIDRRVARVLQGDPTDSVREAGRLRAWVKPGQPWLSRLELDRQVLLDRGGTPTTAVEEVVLTRAAPATDAPARLSTSSVRWVGQSVKPYRGHNRTYAADRAPAGLATADQSRLVQAMTAGLRSESAKERLAARRLLVHGLRARRDLAVVMTEALLGGGLTDKGAGALILGLTDAGTAEAEQALVTILGDERAGPALRAVAAFQTHRQVAPTRATVDALTHLAANAAITDRAKHTSFAALGALVGFGRMPLELEAEVRDYLATAIAEATDKRLQLTLLSSLGNSRHVDLLDDVQRFTAPGNDPTLRVHAMVVLERMGAAPSPSQVLSMLSELHDVRHTERLARLAKTGDFTVTDADVELALVNLAPTATRYQRLAATHLLGRRAASSPELRSELARWYTAEYDASVKKEIGRYVSADELRRARKEAERSTDEDLPVSQLDGNATANAAP